MNPPKSRSAERAVFDIILDFTLNFEFRLIVLGLGIAGMILGLWRYGLYFFDISQV